MKKAAKTKAAKTKKTVPPTKSDILPNDITIGAVDRAFDTAFTDDVVDPFTAAARLKRLILSNPSHALEYAKSLSQRYQIVVGMLKHGETP